MKLETKFKDDYFDFGEIVKAKVTTYYDENKVVVMADRARGGVSRFEYNSIKEFTDNWTDSPEEPKEYWYIGIDGDIYKKEHEYFNEAQDSIGNRFGTKEEAEKVVEKLRAWKRLRENRVHFDLATLSDENVIIIFARKKGEIHKYDKELFLLFGGEE